jgi:hypothetical protein
MGELAKNIEGIGPKYERTLSNAGIKTLEDLRKMDLSKVDTKTQLGLAKLGYWKNMARLQAVDGIDKQYSEGLVKANINDLETLTKTDVDAIISELNKLKNAGVIPSSATMAQVLAWQNDANEILTQQIERRSRLTPEVDIVWEAMTCRGQRNYYEDKDHACHWFHQFGPFHAYDVKDEETLQIPEGYLKAFYVGERYQIPEILSGCRKAPIMSIGLNPNLRAITQPWRIYPYFDSIQQYAKHFRYRTNFKYIIDNAFYTEHTVPNTDKAVFKQGEDIPLHKRYVSMYNEYEKILQTFEVKIGITGSELSLAEDVSYYNFVACHSPRWNMGSEEEEGIVKECFLLRQFFLKQLRQSAPRVIILFGKAIMKSFVEFFRDDFDAVNIPDPTQPYSAILANNNYNMHLEGKRIRVIFSPHPTGARPMYLNLGALNKIVDALEEEYNRGHLKYAPSLKHLERTEGACEFCNNGLFYIEECRYRK